jgi:adenosylhomocysteine nucleosidase
MHHLTRFCLLTYLACALAAASAAAETAGGRIAIVAAFPGEMESILEAIEGEEIERTEIINGVEFHLGTVYGKPAVFFITGVSTVNAGMTTQLALAEFEIETLVFSGIAGGINPVLEKGDVVVPAQWAYHAEGSYFNEDPENPGEYLKNYQSGTEEVHFEMFFPDAVRARRKGMTEPTEKPYFHADRDLLMLAGEIAVEMELFAASGEPAEIEVGGTGVAGPVFMDNADYRKFVYERWNADSLDMESTAIAHVCWANDVPFLIVRCLSDLAGGQAGKNEIAEYGDLAMENAARFVDVLLQRL